MSPRILASAALLVAACHFRVAPALDAAAPADDLAPSATDSAPAASDFARAIPDGATPGGAGWPCDHAADCANGTCVDGYCCDSFCDPSDGANLCRACNVPGSEGHCVAALAGTDPHQQCEPDLVNPCGRDGLCDGSGQCRLTPPRTPCGSASCVAGTLTFAPTCDGAGRCAVGTSQSCAPYLCASASACATDCTPSANGCAPPAVCDANGSCGKRALGQPCGGAGDCRSGFCAQGVCCDGACAGSCHACNLPGSIGRCSPSPAGSSCGAAQCAGDDAVAARACDEAGVCLPGIVKACTPYTCNSASASCFARPCQSNQQCAMGHICNGGSGKCQ